MESSYNINNSSDEEIDLIIEHSYGKGYELFETPEFMEKTDNYMRWKIKVPPLTSDILKIKERRKLYRNEYYNNMSMANLSKWLKERYMDEEAFNSLKGIYKLFEDTRNLEIRLTELEREKTGILEEQKSYREQLKVLADKGEEAVLRKRYIDNMKEQQDRLEKISEEKLNLNNKKKDLEKSIDEAINILASKKNRSNS